MDVDVQVGLTGLRAVVRQPELGGADHLPVLLRDQGPAPGVRVGVDEPVHDRLGRPQDERHGEMADLGEGRDIGRVVGTQIAYENGHGGARYGGRAVGCLLFSRGYGTIAG